MCPGRPKSAGLRFGSAKARMVAARSWALTPVVHPSSKSTVTVNGVPSIEVFSSTWWGSCNSWALLMVMGAHSTPRPFCSMKLTFSGVMVSAAVMKSPSFSRSSSSTTMTNFPCRKSSMASSMFLKFSFMYVVIYFLNSFDDTLCFRQYRVHVVAQANPIAPNAQEEEQPHGEDDAC